MKLMVFIKELDTTPFIYDELVYFQKKFQLKIICETADVDNRLNPECIVKIKLPSGFLWKIKSFLIRHDIWLSYRSSKVRSQINQVIEDFQPDLIQSHYGNDSLLLLDNVSISIPTIVMFHGYDASSWLQNKTYVKKLRKYLSNEWVTTVTCAEDMMDRISQQVPSINSGKVVYYGVDTEFFQFSEAGHENGRKQFLQISVFREKKGLSTTIRAFAAFKERNPDSDFRLILAGNGELAGELKDLVMELNMESEVEFPGWLNRSEARQYLHNADVFVHHSVTTVFGDMEGMPNAIIEAMAVGLPILSTYHSGIPELVKDGVNGYLVPEKNIDAYVLAIEQAMKMPKLKENSNKVVENFSLNRRRRDMEKLMVGLPAKEKNKRLY